MADLLLYPERPVVDADLVARLGALPTPAVSDSQERLAGTPGLLPVPGTLAPGERVAGPALTIRTAPGDNLALHVALDLAEPGDVLVVDAGGYTERAVYGGLLARYARAQGVAGVVVDGAVRDIGELAALGRPVFARSITHVGPFKNGPGEARGPVSIGGAVVSQGDAIVADADGVAIVPADRAAGVCDAAEALVRAEAAAVADIDAGRWERPWVAAAAVRTLHTTPDEVTR